MVQHEPFIFDPANAERLTRPDRKEFLDPDRIFGMTPIADGQTVVDVGCGPGYFLLPLARRLPHGKVVGTDIEPRMLEMANTRLAEAGLDGVELLLGEADDDVPLADSSVDGALLSLVLHEGEHGRRLLAAAQRVLRPGGWCAVIDWHKRETGMGPPVPVRLTPDDVRALAAEVGLSEARFEDLNERYYFFLFRK